jgi:uncharacterized membrane protein (DUF2068 family)
LRNHPHPIREANEKVEHALHLESARRKLRIVAVIDLFKGLVVLAIGFGLMKAHHNVLESGGVSLLNLLDIDTSLIWSRRFLAFLHAADNEHQLLVLAACAYAGLRFVEGWGLWNVKNWARWLGIVSCGIYVPFELYYLATKPSWTSGSVLAINLAVLWLLWPRKALLPTPPPETPAA